jgi:molybdopterin converting factor small subunit
MPRVGSSRPIAGWLFILIGLVWNHSALRIPNPESPIQHDRTESPRQFTSKERVSMVTITLMGDLETSDGERSLSCELEDPLSVKQLIKRQGRKLRQVTRLLRENKVMVTINRRVASEDTSVHDGDEISLVAHDGMSTKGLGPSFY